MSREKIKEKIKKIVGQQIMSKDMDCAVQDLYPIDSDILNYAYDYVPIKILKRIIERHTEDK
tara:strand:+ start:101 stop:286 length:186 start_codon:yes stop_codon:yes gene_type:complete